jgi:membrane-associated phospholipid phosphatase
MKKIITIFLSILAIVNAANAQPDSIPSSALLLPEPIIMHSYTNKPPPAFPIKKLILPGTLLGYGLLGFAVKPVKKLDNSLREEMWQDQPHQPIKIDNYLQYGPGFSAFALEAAGVHGKNNLGNKAMIFLLSNAIMGAIVNPLKMVTKLQRPDGFGTNAFPSGHTATAFAGATFLDKEYHDVSPWYAVGGYALATTVGVMRVYNNRHWGRDVVAGAGVGIISTQLAYWIYPKIQKMLRKKKS